MATGSTTLFFCKECLQYFLDSTAALQHSCKKDEEAATTEVAVASIEGTDELSESTPEVQNETFQIISSGEVIGNNPNRRGWTDKETLCLITACKKHQEKFGNPGYKMKKVWEEIAFDMSKQGIQVSPEHVTNKWKSLLKAYRKAKQREARGDHRRTTFKFYEVIDKLLGSSSAVLMNVARNRIPDVSVSVTPTLNNSLSVSYGASDEEDTDCEGMSSRKRMRRSKSTEILAFLRDYLEEKRKDEQKRHREIMELEKKKVDLLSAICTNMNK